MTRDEALAGLLHYGERRGLIAPEDRTWAVNGLLEALGLRRLAAQAGYRYERGEDTDA